MAYLEERKLSSEFHCTSKKKNIFLIGDSIREGYCSVLKQELADFANLFYMDENNRNTQYVITNLNGYAGKFTNPELVDIVCFNCGHWDIAHWNGAKHSLTSKKEYAKNIEILISSFKKLFINAEVVFSTTTPMNPNGEKGINIRTTEEIAKYNRIAKRVCRKNNVKIIDINSFVLDWGSEYYKDYCHYTEHANLLLGKKIANEIKKL